jgi:hypothetical protein
MRVLVMEEAWRSAGCVFSGALRAEAAQPPLARADSKKKTFWA